MNKLPQNTNCAKKKNYYLQDTSCDVLKIVTKKNCEKDKLDKKENNCDKVPTAKKK